MADSNPTVFSVHGTPFHFVRADAISDLFLLSESLGADERHGSASQFPDLDRKVLLWQTCQRSSRLRSPLAIVGLSESTLAKLRLNGNGPVYCKLGRRVVYRLADLEQWLQSRTVRDTSDADARFLKALTVAHPR